MSEKPSAREIAKEIANGFIEHLGHIADEKRTLLARAYLRLEAQHAVAMEALTRMSGRITSNAALEKIKAMEGGE